MNGGESKAPLVLMEQVIMVFVFALAAALCVQVFVYARGLSIAMESRDHALNITQTVAESVKAFHGDTKQMQEFLGGEQKEEFLLMYFDADWKLLENSQDAAYQVSFLKGEEVDSCGYGEIISISLQEYKEIVTMPVAWQED